MVRSEQKQRGGTLPKANLSPQTVVERALELAEEDGIEAVTIRRLATALGVTPMALYWHFSSKDDLLDSMAGYIFEKIDLTVNSSVTWQEQLRSVLDGLVSVLRAYPATARLISTRTGTSESSLRATETVLDILRRAGFSPAEATQVARHALSTVTNLVSGIPGVVAEDESAAQAQARRTARVSLETLPPEQYPRLVEAAGPLSECEDPDAYFAFGLDLLLAGIDVMAARKQSADSRHPAQRMST